MDTKKSWQSKTVWLNGIMLSAGVFGYLTTNEIIREYPVVVAALVVAQSVCNLILRFATVKPVKLK